MIWFFSIIVIVQATLWINLIRKKKYGTLIITGLIGIFSIWSYVDAYMKYIFVDPCQGIDGCMNETGIIFVVLTMLVLLSIFISLFVLFLDRYHIKTIQKHN